MSGLRPLLLACLLAAVPRLGEAQSVSLPSTGENAKQTVVLPPITVESRRSAPAAAPSPQQTTEQGSGAPGVADGTPALPSLASQMTVSGDDINARPVTRPGEVLEAAPGLIVTQHSGEGKANQYFLRGYNLDHGTDLAITVDDMPVNMRTHAHGQGYADLNWLIPETVNSVAIRKGPYFADVGDFSTAGALDIGLIDSVDKKIAKITLGSFGYARWLGLASAKDDSGVGTWLVANELGTYRGPWEHPDDMRKLNGFIRYSQGTATDGTTVTAMAYSNKWNSTDQIPERAILSGLLNRFGEEDPTDGGVASRFSLSARTAHTDAIGSWKANVYVIKSKLDLFNDFTYFLSDPVQGDQFHQHDDRILTGGAIARTINGSFARRPAETTIGLQVREDNVKLGLTDTYQRSFLSDIRTDKVNEASSGLYAQNTVHWTDWLRTTLGWRGDLYAVNVHSYFDPNNSGAKRAAISSPKLSIVIGPFYNTEFFAGAGMGFHSNDARGVTITEDPTDPTTKLSASPLLVRTKGAEVGVRSKILPGLDTSVSVFALDQASEIVFNGDGGDTSPSRPSRRYGIEWTNRYRPLSWVKIDGDLAVTHARFTGFDSDQEAVYESLAGFPQAQIGNAPGNYIPNAPAVVASAGITLGEKTGWFGTLRWRYLGASPLTEDNAFRSPPTSVFNARLGYNYDNGWSIQLDALNIFNTQANQITYAYGSLLKTDSLYTGCNAGTVPAAVCQNGVMDRVLHPIEPLALRLSITGAF